MSCGCGQPVTAKPGGTKYVRACSGANVSEAAMTAAAMCAACPKRGLVLCTVDGKGLEQHARGQTCPKGRHPKDGKVRWIGLAWYGVPFPLRLWLKWRGNVKDPSKLPGCGCLVWLKSISRIFHRTG